MGSAETIPIGYAPPKDRSIILFYIVYFFMIAVPAAAAAGLVYFWVPAYRGLFMDFKMNLPLMTKMLLGIADRCRSAAVWPLIIVGLLVVPWLLAALTVRFRAPMQRLSAAMIIMCVIMLVSLCGSVFTQFALMLPVVKLLRSVSGGE